MEGNLIAVFVLGIFLMVRGSSSQRRENFRHFLGATSEPGNDREIEPLDLCI